jgi:hypothetical protein
MDFQQPLGHGRVHIHSELSAAVAPGPDALLEQEDAGRFAAPIGGQRELRGQTAFADASWPHQERASRAIDAAAQYGV